ncbi:LamG-like jellyroll fold domain-containing protein [Novipirellula artificiosorum]|uniref:FecR protein n=1 Tax=Novipirellula artificiosorum TaxID=2528016 RepID=A0A5C6DY74_9BACT|nr:LamG-like jellyroll fold domain-containing protein [Novipirellula artificiosorum]TWU42383.1 FecR protein [Novipirellula artificiosorum]
MDKLRRDQFLADWLEGSFAGDGPSEPECAEFLSDLKNDPEFRRSASRGLLVRRFLGQKQIPSGGFTEEVLESLRADSSETFTSAVISNLQVARRKQRRLVWGSVGLATAAMLAFSMFSVFDSSIRNRNNQRPGIRVIAAEGVGTLDTEALQQGKPVQLRRGILEIVLDDKARVVIEAPASFTVVSRLHVRLDEGRCFAELKKGMSGLRIETPSRDVFDLGTKFAVEVSSSKDMEVHVFDGTVEVSDGTDITRLTEGQGLAVGESGVLSRLSADSSRFVPRVPRSELKKQPLIYWSFDEGTGDTVKATGRDPNLELATGTLMSAAGDGGKPTWISGVVGQALAFDGKSGWVNTRHPGISGDQDRTIACWVKLPDESHTTVSTMIGWGMGKRNRGLEKACFLESAQSRPEHPGHYSRLRLVAGNRTMGTTNLRDGRWHHVAAVAMAGEDAPTILLYVDGQLEQAAQAQCYLRIR